MIEIEGGLATETLDYSGCSRLQLSAGLVSVQVTFTVDVGGQSNPVCSAVLCCAMDILCHSLV